MTWHKAYYKDRENPYTVTRLEGSFSLKDILERAQETANRTGAVVTIISENGMKIRTREIEPQK